MKKFEVDFTDNRNGSTSAIDTIIVADNYTSDDYIRDCKENADDDWNEMLANGQITLVEVEDE